MSHPRRNEVEEFVTKNRIAVFMKGTPQFPMCGFSNRACQALMQAGADINDIAGFNILEDRDLFEALKEYSDWPTSPQIFIGGKFLGGGDDVVEMLQSGALSEIVGQK